MIKLKRGATISEYLGIQPICQGDVRKWVAVAVLIVGLFDGLNILLGRAVVPEFMSIAYSSADPVWLLWFAVVLAAPLFEELFFRGFLLEGFRLSFLGPIGAVLLTSAAWAAIHLQYDTYDLTVIFLFGCILGAAKLKTGSVLLPMGMHALTNCFATFEAAILQVSISLKTFPV